MRAYRKRKSIAGVRFAELVRMNKKQLVLLGVAFFVVAALIAAVVYFAGRQGFSSSFLVTGDTIRIGLRTDISGFGRIGESGEIEGFDRDFIDEALSRMLPGQEKLYEYKAITSQNAGASIKYGSANISLGLLVEGTERTDGFRITRPYYTDTVVAVVHGGSRLDKLENMAGGRIGVLAMALDPDGVEEYLKKNKLETNLLRYSDYESAMSDIEHNRVGAVVMPYAIARQFETTGFRILAAPLYDIGYSVMLPTGQVAFTLEMNEVIDEMERDGTLEELRRKWDL